MEQKGVFKMIKFNFTFEGEENETYETFVKIKKVSKGKEPHTKDARRHEWRQAMTAKHRSF